MKRFYSIFITALLSVLLIGGCRKEFSSMALVSHQVKVIYPELYAKKYADNAQVKLTNTVTNQSFIALTNADGLATFEGLLQGNYQVNVVRNITAAEALVLIGYEDEVFLNGSTLNHKISGEEMPYEIALKGSKLGGLIFKEIFYSGSRSPSGGTYFSDQYYEIYNNSNEVIYADSLCIGDTGGAPGNSTTAKPFGFQSDPDHVYLQNVWMVPGTGKSHPIEPGESIIIAQDGINHKTDPLGNANSPVNLGEGIADYESYVERADNKDVDAPAVPNLYPIYLGSVGFDWLVSVFGTGMVIFKHPEPDQLPFNLEPGSTGNKRYVQVPITYVLDAVDISANANASNYKKVPIALDGGFTYNGGSYTGTVVRRKVKTVVNGRRVLLDTNNSTQDFETSVVAKPKSW